MTERSEVYLGPCCACGRDWPEVPVLTVRLLNKKAPVRGRGWGCMHCGLPPDGALVVLCDPCIAVGAEPRWACAGDPVTDGRVPITDLTEPHEHDPSSHGWAA